MKSEDVAPLTGLFVEKVRTGITDRYKRAMATKAFKVQDVDAGREYIEAYVTYIHYVEGLYEATMNPVSGHYPEETSVPHEDK